MKFGLKEMIKNRELFLDVRTEKRSRFFVLSLIMVFLFLGCNARSTKNIVPDLNWQPQLAKSYEYKGRISGDDFYCGSFNEPLGLAVDVLDNLYLVDSGNHRICKFDARLDFVTEFGQFGWDSGQFQNPTDIVIDRSVHLYVVDAGNDRIEKFSHEGVYLGSLIDENSAEFERLEQIALDRQGHVYVTDRENDTVLKFDMFGNLNDVLGGFGFEPGQLNLPSGIWISPLAEIFVADSENDRILVFNSVGNVCREIRLRETVHHPVMKRPLAVTGDLQRNIFVVNAESTAILVFNEKGDFLFSIEGNSNAAFALKKPGDLAINRDGLLFVSDSESNCIQMFEIKYSVEKR